MAVEQRHVRGSARLSPASTHALGGFLRSSTVQRGLLGLAHAHRAVLVRRAGDVTERVRRRSCLVVAPHPDDETLGCGATMRLKLLAGARVDVLVVTDGRYSHDSKRVSADELAARREAESRAACAELGVPSTNVHFLRLHERAIASERARVVGAIEALASELRPQDVFVPCGVDRLEDHRALHDAAMQALRHVSRDDDTDVYEYPIWYWHPRAWTGDARPSGHGPLRALTATSPVVVRTRAHTPAKRRALSHYRTQMAHIDGDPGWITMDPWFVSLFTKPEELFFRSGTKVESTS